MGLCINITALVWIIPVYVFAFFPPVPKPTTTTMNWSIVMYIAVIAFSTFHYVLWGRKQLTPPAETIEDYIRAKVNDEVEDISVTAVSKRMDHKRLKGKYCSYVVFYADPRRLH
jgi:hypothetical protein